MVGRSFPKFILSLLFFLFMSVAMPVFFTPLATRESTSGTGTDSIGAGHAEDSHLTDVAFPAETPEANETSVRIPLFDHIVTPPASSQNGSGTSGFENTAGTDNGNEPGGAYDPLRDDGTNQGGAEGVPGAGETGVAGATTLPPFEPHAVDGTEPSRMLVSSHIMANDIITDEHTFPVPIDFGYGTDYTTLEGVLSFRGNNFRDAPAYGTADIKSAKFGDKWVQNTGSLVAPDGAYWSGNGWSGQPLIVKWPIETRALMNMHDWAKTQAELVEVIYPSMDGYIYFSELETGRQTRAKLNIGYTFKGAGSIDPRGYPLLYVGAGYGSAKGAAKIFVISLIDGKVLYSFGSGDRFAYRSWTAADASPLVDAETDNLIYPSENGLLYIVNLNSNFDPENGTVSVDPAPPVKWRYKGKRSQSAGKYWLGIESSPVIWRGYLFTADNGGHLICLDLNTLKPVWVQDVLDDTNNTPVLELEDGHPYLYISTGFHGGWRAAMDVKAPVPVWKIDAATGEVVWQTEYQCYTSDGVSGGVQGTIASGKNNLANLVFVPVSRTPTRGAGVLAALDKTTGAVVWEYKTSQYGWSSPVCVYDGNGKGYVIFCSSGGTMYLFDGLTGKLLDSVVLGGVIEASPAVYNSTVVVGTRAMRIWGVTLT